MRGARITALAGALVAMGCGSSLHARRLQPGGNIEGIPYSLPEASFVISESPATADKPTTYGVALALSPSTKDLYWVRVAPSTFSSTDLTLTLSSQGQLATFNGQSSPALVPVVQAIGEFVVAGLGVAARAVAPFADTSGLATPGISGELASIARLDDKDKREACAARSDVKKLVEDIAAQRAPASALDAALGRCVRDVGAAIPEIQARLNPDLDAPSNVARLYATNETQRVVLDLAAQQARTFRHPRMDEAKANYQKLGPKKDRDADVERIDKGIEKLSKPDVAAVEPSSPPASADDRKKFEENLKLVKDLATRAIDERLLAKEFELAAKLPAREWRNRHATVNENRRRVTSRLPAAAPPPTLSDPAAPPSAVCVSGMGSSAMGANPASAILWTYEPPRWKNATSAPLARMALATSMAREQSP